MERGSHIEIPIAGAETTPGKYYEGEDAQYDGADVRPTVGGVASGTGSEGRDIPVIDADGKGGIIYRQIVNNEAVKEKSIPWDKRHVLGPISEHYLGGQ